MEWLCNEIVGTHLNTHRVINLPAQSRDYYDENVLGCIIVFQVLANLKTTHPGHYYVEENEVLAFLIS